jgi:signal transduction histidine kinase
LLLAVLITWGPRWAPAAALAVVAAELLVRGGPAPWPVLLAAGSCIAFIYAVLATWLRRWGMRQPIESVALAVRLIMATALATFVAAVSYVTLFVIAGVLPRSQALASVASYWVGDFNGIITLTPLLLMIGQWRALLLTLRTHFVLITIQLALVVLTMWAIFGLSATDGLKLFYPLFVPVIWITMRWGITGALLSTLIIQIGLVITVEIEPNAPRLIDLQFLQLTLSLTALLLGAVVANRQRAENQLRERDLALSRAMRFAVAGELASSLAHELNQPITALVSYLQASEILAAPLKLQDQRLDETLNKATREAVRAAEVLRRMRDFYRGGTIKRERLQLHALCQTFASTFAERLRRVSADLQIDVPMTLPSVEVGATQLEIILHNLLSNALDAVSGQNRGHILLSARAAEGAVTLYIEDSGAGIASEVRAKLFEPFFTTKVDGMGLGLAISRSLLRAQGGELLYEQGERWGGACFVVRLPLPLSEVQESSEYE